MAKSENNYRANVLDVNANYKNVTKSVGGIRSLLLSVQKEIALPAKTKAILMKSKKDQEVYELINKEVRKCKDGTSTTVFYMLQKLGSKAFIAKYEAL